MELIALIISIIALSIATWTWWFGTREENWAIDFDLMEWGGNVQELSEFKMDGSDETGKYRSS
jgi:hypothetical protein